MKNLKLKNKFPPRHSNKYLEYIKKERKLDDNLQEMRDQINKFIKKCNNYELIRIYSEFKRLNKT